MVNHNVFLQGWIVGSRLRGHESSHVKAGAGGGSGEYDKASFLAGLAAGMASRGGLPWMRAIGELPGWVPAGAVIHKILSVNNPPREHREFGPYDEIGVVFAVDDGAVIEKSGVCIYTGIAGFWNPAIYRTYAIITGSETIRVGSCYYYNGKLIGGDVLTPVSFTTAGALKYFQTMSAFEAFSTLPYSCIYGPTVFSSEAALGEYMGADIPKY